MKVKDEKLIEAKKIQIMRIAEAIILNEGIDALSIRKIAKQLNQTPGIIYHYFKSKDDILVAIVDNGYQEILQTITKYNDVDDPVKRIHDTLYAYIKVMIKKDRLFLILMESKVGEIRQRVDVLTCDIHTRNSIAGLTQVIEKGISLNVFCCKNAEIRAKTIWASMYGLISRIINEDVDEDLSEQLIEDQIKMFITSLRGATN